MARRTTGMVQAPGLAKFTRDLGKISKEYRKDVLRHFREIGKSVRGTAHANAQAEALTGELAGSYKVSARNKGAAITSRLPQAGVLEYGGDIAPRGTTIHFEPRLFVSNAIETRAGDIEDQFGDLLDRVGRANGFR